MPTPPRHAGLMDQDRLERFTTPPPLPALQEPLQPIDGIGPNDPRWLPLWCAAAGVAFNDLTQQPG